MKKIILLAIVFMAAQAKANDKAINIDDVDFDALVAAEELEAEMSDNDLLDALEADGLLSDQVANFTRHPRRDGRNPHYRPPHRRSPHYQPPHYRPHPPRRYPSHYSYVCYASDNYNQTFSAIASSPRIAQRRALDRCYSHSRHCYSDGCRRRY